MSTGGAPAGARTAYLGLGSNEGDRLANLRSAVELLRATPGIRVQDGSSVYETEPVGEVLDQPDFFNAVLRIETELDPHLLLSQCKRIEAELGRRPGGPTGGPRPIDVDVLLVGELTIADERLVIPHPEVTRRRFVLEPLLELDPALTLPGGTSLGESLEVAPGQRVAAVAPPLII